jgi:hypothetical protein
VGDLRGDPEFRMSPRHRGGAVSGERSPERLGSAHQRVTASVICLARRSQFVDDTIDVALLNRHTTRLVRASTASTTSVPLFVVAHSRFAVLGACGSDRRR